MYYTLIDVLIVVLRQTLPTLWERDLREELFSAI